MALHSSTPFIISIGGRFSKYLLRSKKLAKLGRSHSITDRNEIGKHSLSSDVGDITQYKNRQLQFMDFNICGTLHYWDTYQSFVIKLFSTLQWTVFHITPAGNELVIFSITCEIKVMKSYCTCTELSNFGVCVHLNHRLIHFSFSV
jgi:hypothetical protein